MRLRSLASVLALAVVGLLAGCGGDQSTLDPKSETSGEIADLWWAMLIGAAVVLLAVVVLYGFALVRRRVAAEATTSLPRPAPLATVREAARSRSTCVTSDAEARSSSSTYISAEWARSTSCSIPARR